MNPARDYAEQPQSMAEQVPPQYTEAERPQAQRFNMQRPQPAALQRSLSRATMEQQLQPNYGGASAASDYASMRAKERTEYTAKERTPSTAYNPSSTDFVPKDRPNPNFVLPSQMRPPGVAGQPPPPQPRPPFAGARPMVGVGPRPPMPPNMVGRGMPPPLRPTDSKSNLLMGPPPPSQMRPGMPPQPQLNMQQAQRMPNSGGPLSPPGQGPPRPPGGGFPWAPTGGGARPAPPPGQNMTRPPPPTFARPMPGQPLQAPFRPPIYNQQQQQQQPQHQQQQQQQLPPQQQQQQQQLRPPSAASVHNENDDDDVIMGQAVTPLKTFNMRNDPMGSPLLEETEPPFDTTSPLTDAPFGKAGVHSKYLPRPLTFVCPMKPFEKIHELLID